jgi:hypothetical protein
MYLNGIGIVLDKSRRDKDVLKDARRADNFTKMALLSAHDAFVDSGLSNDEKDGLGLILTTAFGPHVTTFRFLDDILDYGDASVSPTLFSHSVHNCANSYISTNLGIRGPTLTIADFSNSFNKGLLVAQSWLDEGRCRNILLGFTEEIGPELEFILKIKPIKPAPKEGSAFFLVSAKEGLKNYSQISKENYEGIFNNQDVFSLADKLLISKKGGSYEVS